MTPTTRTAPQVLIVGEALVDVVPDAAGRPRDLPGGSPANVAITLGRLGRAVTLATTLAQDTRGVTVSRWLADSDVVVRAETPASGRTSTARVTLDPDGVPSYAFDLAWDLQEVDVAGADVVHVGSVATVLPPGADVVRDAVRRARGHAVVSLDPNARPALVADMPAARDRVEELVALSDVVKASDEDLRWFFPDEDPADVAARWATWGPGLVVVTRGGDGCTLVRPDGRRQDVPGRSVTVVDTVGAGDTFTGALLDALADMGVHGAEGRNRLRGLSDAALRWAARRAAVAASVTVSRPGANPPTRAELAEVMGPVLPASFDGAPVAGMTWGWTGVRGTWDGPEAQRSMDELEALDAVTWVAVTYAAEQATAQSTDIPFGEEPTVTDDEVRHAVREAQRRGWKVCLKPVVNSADGTWRGHIGFFDQDVPGEPTWDEWFTSYTAFVVHHARIAAEVEAEMFCVGCEMVRADAREEQWRELVRQVREVYPGLVTYNCDKYQEDRLTWWDAVDVISSSGYYPTGTWERHLDRIERVVAREDKPFVFLEAGCPSREGSAARPNDWTLAGAPSGDEQAAYLEEMFEACSRRPWVSGFFLWDWPAELYPAAGAALDDDYCMHGKPGAKVVTVAYQRMRQV
ncbi:PfkB family carbohydrate kinase [Oerskovia sp. Root22]|uniref:PfkB family carbohydrate kinase n=1 Tax=Oerskovia sp. Root22 TaxID=1736494 RepID=UPI0009EB2B32